MDEELRRLARQLDRIREERDRHFGEFSRSSREFLDRVVPSLEEPLCDVSETDNEVMVVADLPGVEKENIKITATEDSLEISAQFKKVEEIKKPRFIRHERRYERFYRRISLPTKVKPEQTKSSYHNGILEVRLSKAEVQKGFEVKVD